MASLMPVRRHRAAAVLAFVIGTIAAIPVMGQTPAAPPEPIAYMGHGAMFDQSGRELIRTEKFVLETQQWYMRDLSSRLSRENRSNFLALEREIDKRKLQGHDRLAVNALLLQWLVDRVEADQQGRLLGKLLALNDGLLERRIGVQGPAKYEMPAALRKLLESRKLLPLPPSGGTVQPLLLVTGVSGPAYRQLCNDHGVPVPPDFGPSWVNRGVINKEDLFIVRGANAEVLTLTSSSPPGLCVALPRFDAASNIVIADGIICLGQSDPMSGPP